MGRSFKSSFGEWFSYILRLDIGITDYDSGLLLLRSGDLYRVYPVYGRFSTVHCFGGE